MSGLLERACGNLNEWTFGEDPMKTVAIIGGKLQGTEAVYLAKKAGIGSLLIDKDPNAPASGFCDRFAAFDVLKKEEELIALLKTADFILPALENDEVLKALAEIAKEHGLKLAFDPAAYRITESKLLSDRLIRERRIPAPCYYPDCDGPYIIKPSGESGSAGVRRAETKEEAEAFQSAAEDRENWVIQEYLEGKSYSIEVIGVPGNYRTYAVTEIHMDDVYDCCMVTSPCSITEKQTRSFEAIGVKLAEMVDLHGIMDVEVIDHRGEFKVLEIDARIPSQTPMVVLHATGTNLLTELMDLTLYGTFRHEKAALKRCASIEHYLVEGGAAQKKGEHIMGEAGPLIWRQSFLGADEVLSDFREGSPVWRGTFINWADTMELLAEKRELMLAEIRDMAKQNRMAAD